MSKSKRSTDPAQRVYVINHPLLQDRLTRLRNKNTSTAEFRFTLEEAGLLLAAEATRHLPTRSVRIQTPLASHKGVCLAHPTVLVPVLRAGLSLLPAFQRLLPSAAIGYIGLARNETTLAPEAYYQKLPKITLNTQVFLLDPMLATGGSSQAALDLLRKHGAHCITLVCLVAAPEGLKKIIESHPDISIYTAAIDQKLNPRGFITPGLGDAGDRLFGT